MWAPPGAPRPPPLHAPSPRRAPRRRGARRADEGEPPICRLLLMLGTEPIASIAPAEMHGHGGALVFLNGNLIGVHRRPHLLVRQVR